jgi:hypothetical protein
MPTADLNEGGIPAAEDGKHDDEGSTRRQVLKGLAVAALTTATVGASAAFADERAQEEPLEDRIIQRSCRDPEFRRRLIANPTAVVAELLGRDFPAGVNVRVVEEDASTVYVVLPPVEGGRAPQGREAQAATAARSRMRCCNHDLTCTHKGRPAG